MVVKKRAKTGGRQKGTPNKVTGQLKDMILGALDDVGGKDYLVTQAKESPNAFLTLLGKVLPSEVKADLTSGGKELPVAAPVFNVTVKSK